jgi:hypothetical protein
MPQDKALCNEHVGSGTNHLKPMIVSIYIYIYIYIYLYIYIYICITEALIELQYLFLIPVVFLFKPQT